MVKTHPHASNAGGTGLIPGLGTNSPHAMWYSQKKKMDLLYKVTGVTESVNWQGVSTEWVPILNHPLPLPRLLPP